MWWQPLVDIASLNVTGLKRQFSLFDTSDDNTHGNLLRALAILVTLWTFANK